MCGHGSLPRLPLHKNPGLEIVLIRRGVLSWQTEGIEESVAPGMVYFTLPGQLHGSSVEFEPGHEWTFVVLAADWRRDGSLRLHPGLSLAPRELKEISCLLTTTLRHAAPATAGLTHLLPELVSEAQAPGSFHEAKVRHLAGAVVIELARSLSGVVPEHGRHARASVERRVLALLEKLAADPCEKWTLAALAAECGLGRTRFSTLFLKLSGDTPIRHLNRLRVQRACRLLRETQRPITRIAMDCGFESSQYFARIFKQFTGGIDARTYRNRRGSLL
jgi:AraC family L-rhamnose operon regulatory protein RhaS